MQLQINLLEVFHGQRKIVGASGHIRIKASYILNSLIPIIDFKEFVAREVSMFLDIFLSLDLDSNI
jgi:hypothetical protein